VGPVSRSKGVVNIDFCGSEEFLCEIGVVFLLFGMESDIFQK